jgi:hypothetical protein
MEDLFDITFSLKFRYREKMVGLFAEIIKDKYIDGLDNDDVRNFNKEI